MSSVSHDSECPTLTSPCRAKAGLIQSFMECCLSLRLFLLSVAIGRAVLTVWPMGVSFYFSLLFLDLSSSLPSSNAAPPLSLTHSLSLFLSGISPLKFWLAGSASPVTVV